MSDKITIWDMERAVADAKEIINNANRVYRDMGVILQGNLHHLNSWTLAKLKRELKDFNSHTRQWKG